MPTLKLYLLGPPRLRLDEEELSIGRQKALALLCFLAVNGESQRSDTLATLLWTEHAQQQARRALSRHLFELKEQLGDEWLVADEQMIALRAAPRPWLDVAQFHVHLAECAKNPAAGHDALQAAVALYRDDFLADFTLPDCPAFDEWRFFQGEELRRQLASASVQLIELLADQGGFEAALPHARRWLALDALHEPAHQALMRLYAATGQQAAALRQYQLCVQTLKDELGVLPTEETTALYEQIRTGKHGQEPETHGNRALSAVAESGYHRPTLPLHTAAPLPANVRYDWREAPAVERTFGRETERQQLTNWLVGEHCRLVSILGIGGLGKTTLAAQVVRDLVTGEYPPFTLILWRSLLNASPLAELLPDILHFLALPNSVELPESLDKRLALLREYLTHERSLLVFDYLESIIEAGERGGRYRAGYEDYAQLFYSLGQHEHQSCLSLTSRERPQEIGRLERASTAVGSLSLKAPHKTFAKEVMQW